MGCNSVRSQTSVGDEQSFERRNHEFIGEEGEMIEMTWKNGTKHLKVQDNYEGCIFADMKGTRIQLITTR